MRKSLVVYPFISLTQDLVNALIQRLVSAMSVATVNKETLSREVLIKETLITGIWILEYLFSHCLKGFVVLALKIGDLSSRGRRPASGEAIATIKSILTVPTVETKTIDTTI